MSKLHQVQIKYEPVEDRALLRIRTQEAQEMRFWLTRRLTRGLWKLLMHLLASDSEVVRHSDERAKSAVLSFKHEEAIARSDFTTQYQGDQASAATGDAPLLLVKAEGRLQKDGRRLLRLHPQGGQVVQLVLDDKLTHSLCKIISDMVRGTDWDLQLEVGDPSDAGTDEAPRVLN